MFTSWLPRPSLERGALAGWLEAAEPAAQRRRRATRSTAIAWSWARLLTFGALAFGVYLALARGQSWGIGVAAAGVALFGFAIRRHQSAARQTRRLDHLMMLIDESRRRLSGEPVIIRGGRRPEHEAAWEGLPVLSRVNGSSESLSAQEIEDLDIFGEPLSVYGLLNRTSSTVGEAQLCRSIIHPGFDVAAMRGRQEAVDHLADDAVARFELMAAAAEMRDKPASCIKFFQTVRDATPIPNRGWAAALRPWGMAGPLAIAFGIAVTAGWIAAPVTWLPLIVVVIVNAIVMPSLLKGVRERLRPWLELESVTSSLLDFCETAARTLPREGELGRIRRACAAAAGSACLPSLRRWIPLTFLGLSGIFHTIIDVLVFWDLQVLWLLERSYLRRRGEILWAVAALGHCEALLSLACFSAEYPEAAWPEIVEDGCRLELENGRHPLIAANEVVGNDLSLGGTTGTWVITGSNMSGKSTFLRMAGVSALLAQMGSAVAADRMTLSPMALMTDLRIRDDLSRQESYFLAEVRQVRRMIEATRDGRAVLCLIDEPFRGTNSGERVAAAAAITTALVAGGGVHLIATHDEALAAMEFDGKAANYHFSESFEQNQMVFDYHLRPGPARGRNALNVLEAEGYPSDIVAEARRRWEAMAATAPARRTASQSPPPR